MGTRLFVGNVDKAVTPKTLEKFFAEAGKVVAVKIPKDHETQQPRGFAFVEFSTAEAAERAIETLDETELEGRRIRVKLAYESKHHGGSRRKPDRGWDAEGDGQGEPQRRSSGSRRGDDGSERRGKPRKHGKHGSDRVRGRGTRRYID